MTSTPTTFLIADDSQLTYVLQRYADSYGARLMVADFQAPVVALAAHEQPTLILLGLTGVEDRGRMALRALRADQRTCAIPIVLCTAHEIDQQDWAAEADRVLVQPIMYTEFAAMLDQVIQSVLRTNDRS
jgi:CheY-like chemotaxis protein